MKYKVTGNKAYFVRIYHELILDKLDAKTVYQEIGPNAVLVSNEKADEFGPRRIIATWMEKELGIEVKELP